MPGLKAIDPMTETIQNTDAVLSELNLRELIGRISKTQAETDKLMEEGRKFVAEQHKLAAEAQKLQRDHGPAPWTMSITMVSVGAALAVAIIALLKSMGVL